MLNKTFTGAAGGTAVLIVLTACQALCVQVTDGRSPIAEPYPYVNTGNFSGPAVPESPDPLVAYRWPSPKATDGLEIYLLKPTTISSDTKASFDNLGSLTTDHPNVTVNGAGSIRMDFGRESAAWLEFDSPDCPGGIEMSISEYNQPAIVNQMPLHPVKTLAPVKYGNTYRLELNKELYEGVRFGWIHVRSFTGVWHITGIRLVCQVKPINYKGNFSCSDPMLTRVWYTGAYGVKLNLLKDYLGAILMDRGDRHSWTGDSHPSQAASMAAFGNFDFVRSNLERTSGKDWILSYMLYWVSSLLDYYNNTGDTELLNKYTENISAKLDDAYTAYGTNPQLGFYGWDERLAGFEVQSRNCPEAQNAYKMLSIRAWNDFARAMGSIGRTDLRDKYNGYVTEKVSQLRQNATWYQDFGVHAMSDAVNAGFTSRTEQEKMFALEYNDKVNRVSFSPFNQYFIIQAMASMKRHDDALDSVRYLWGGMIEYGGTTFFEAFRPAWAKVLGKNDPVPNNQCGFTSLCHPWGGGVVKWLSEEVAGIKPVSPGFKEYAIVPHLGRSLTWVKGTVPTPHGEIGMSINVDSGEMSMSAPAGTIGRLGIPKMEKTIRSIVFDNVVVWDGVFHAANGVGGAEEDPDFVYLTKVQPGTHAITVKYSGTTPGYVEPLEHYDVDCIRQDSATGGSWGGKYGAEGYVLFSYNGENNDVRALPSYVKSLDIYNHRSVQWTNQTSDLRALSPDKSNGVPRKAACIYTGNGGPTDVVRSWDGQPLTVSIEANGTRSYQVAFYFVDWDKLGRSIAVEMFDAKTLKMVAPVQVIKDHVAGCYLIYKYDKSVKFRIQQIRGANAALCGIFFDPAAVDAPMGVERVARPATQNYSSPAVTNDDTVCWIQVDLGRSLPIDQVKLFPIVEWGWLYAAEDKRKFFPVRFNIEASDDAEFKSASIITDQTGADYTTIPDAVVIFPGNRTTGRYVRLTATRLSDKQLALMKVEVWSGGTNVAEGCPVADSFKGNLGVTNLTLKRRPQDDVVTDNPGNVIPADQWKPVAYKAQAPLGGVHLADGLFKTAMQNNIAYLMNTFTVDEMVRDFRNRAGKPNPEGMREPEAFWDTGLAGQNAGRFLMGAGNTLRWIEDPALRKRMNDIVDVIEECRQPDGYIMAFPANNICECERAGYTRAWVTHGLIEAGYAGNPKAFPLLRGFYDWFNQCPYLPELLRRPNQSQQGTVANTRLYFTPIGKAEDLQVVQRYFQENYWLDQLAKRDTDAIWKYPYDRPHCYLLTAIEPYLDLYRATGKRHYLEAAMGGWDLYHDNWEHIGGSIAICEGGSYPPKSYIFRCTGELCGSVFMARLSQRFHLLDPEQEKYVGEIEKAIYNITLPNQMGDEVIVYHARMVGRKDEQPNKIGTCCEGQGTRMIGSIPEYIYSIAPDGLYVDLFAPSEITWQQDKQTIKVQMITGFPFDNNVALRFSLATPVAAKVRVRVPAWSSKPMALLVNNTLEVTGVPGTYATLERTWKEGDRITFTLPAELRMTQYEGKEASETQPRYALEYGPILLAAVGVGADRAEASFDCGSASLLSRIKPVAGQPLHFSIEGESNYSFIPYWEVASKQTFTCFPIVTEK